MSTIDWNALANNAASQTDSEFNSVLAGLTSLKASEIDTFIAQSNISNANAVKVLQEINNTTTSNIQKAQAIATIENGVGFLVSLVTKII